jgi:hypothetical protein
VGLDGVYVHPQLLYRQLGKWKGASVVTQQYIWCGQSALPFFPSMPRNVKLSSTSVSGFSLPSLKHLATP